jgi:23S rRNA U2552 (ribose-2'-O)-methylase RlmE/FtsJ
LVLNAISTYTPPISLNESIKKQSWEEFHVLVSSVSIFEKLFIGEEFNKHVGSTRVAFHKVHESMRNGSRNQEEEDVFNFALA